jgi:hypothetical protein
VTLRQTVGNRWIPIFQHRRQMVEKDNRDARLIAYFAIHEVRPIYTDCFGSGRVEGRGHGFLSAHPEVQDSFRRVKTRSLALVF